MAAMPILLLDTPFGATTSLSVTTDGRFDYLKTTLYQLSNNAQVAIAQTSQLAPTMNFGNLQASTSYRVVVGAYKLGGLVASTSQDVAIANDTSAATLSLSLKVPYISSTIAGNGIIGCNDDTGTAATFDNPRGIAIDPAGNLLICEWGNHRIRKISPQRVVSTLAGNATVALIDGTGAAASFHDPYCCVLDPQNNLYVADCDSHSIRKVTPAGVVTTVAGSGSIGVQDGTGRNANFHSPIGINIDSQGNLVIGDFGNQRIRKINAAGVVTTFAGNGVVGFTDGTGTNASFHGPCAIAIDPQDNLFVVEYYNHCIRKITPGGVVTTFAGNGATGFADGTGTSAAFNYPIGLVMDKQLNFYVSDTSGHRIRKVTPQGVVTTLAGNGATSPFADGTGTCTTLISPIGIAVDPLGNIYYGDTGNHMIRVLR
jgi:sugar lactone lactonase YvrE